MCDLFGTPELLYTRRWAGFGEFLGGGDERWDLTDGDDRVVATVVETDLTVLRRAGRFLNNLFPDQQRHRLEIRDSTDHTLFTVVKQPPKLGLEYAEVWMGDGSPAGTIRLISPEASDRFGLAFYDPRDERLGEVRYAKTKTSATGSNTFAVLTADGTEIAEFSGVRTHGGGGPVGYRLHVSQDLSEPLRSMVYASPIVRYFIR